MMKWLLAGILAIVAALTALLRLLPNASSAVPPASSPIEPHLESNSWVEGIGYIEPASEIRRLMFRTGGVVKRCYVQAGDFVHKGDLLLELEDATQRADVEVARQNLGLARAEAADENAGINPYKIHVVEQTVQRLRENARYRHSEADRFKRMLASHSASQQEYDAAETRRRQTEVELQEQDAELLHLRNHVTPEHRAMLTAKVKHAEAALGAAEERLRETELFAPFDGTVLKLIKREGEGVRSFEPEPVLLFGDLSRMRVRAEIDERHVRRLAPDQVVVAYGRNLQGKEYRGKIVYLERVMGDKTVFTRGSSERKDLDVLQAVVEMGPEFQAPPGLQVDVRVVTSDESKGP